MGKKKENSFLLGYYKKSLCIFVSYTPQLFKNLKIQPTLRDSSAFSAKKWAAIAMKA